MGISTGPIKEGYEASCHGYGKGPHWSSTSLEPIATSTPRIEGDSQHMPKALKAGESCGILDDQGSQLFNRTSTNLFPDVDFDLNYDYANSSDTLFRPDYLPIPDFLSPHETPNADQVVSTSNELPSQAESSVSSSSRSKTSPISHRGISSSSFPNASIAPSDMPLPDDEPTRYLAVSRATALTCEECPRVFTSTSLLKRHLKTHTRFACTKGCTKSFTSKKDRGRHDATIHGNQIVQCPKCDHMGRKDNMKRHMKIHEGRPTQDMNIG